MKTKLPLLLIPSLLLTACGASTTSVEPSSQEPTKELVQVEEREVQYLNDNYQNFYQIFVYSYADSNGDGVGDLRGIIEKFDYIKSLGVTGLWLTPVNPSDSYHKYDVKDYKDIDRQFGTMEDYDELVDLCHQNHMKIILDLVLNHSSIKHPWFDACLEARINFDTDDQYYNYYSVVEIEDDVVPAGYYRYKDSDFAYEGRFWDQMPDFNLQGIIDGTNEYLIHDFQDIMTFWLDTHDIDGFRLDACTSFFTGQEKNNFAFLNWVKEQCESIKPGSYVIGEVLEGSSTYSKYYKNTSVDSYFCFDDGAKYRNNIFNPINRENAVEINTYIARDIRYSYDHIPAPTIANHDIGRSYKMNAQNNRLLHAFMALGAGATFEYYGEEIGMANIATSPEDLGFRTPVNWGDKYTCRPASSMKVDEADAYPLGSVAAQDADPDSLLNYYRKAYKYRLENPELARGDTAVVSNSEDESCALIKREYNGSAVYLAINLSKTLTNEIDLGELNVKVVGDLSVGETPYYQDDKLMMPPLSVLILH